MSASATDESGTRGGSFAFIRSPGIVTLTALLRRVKAKSDAPGRVATAHGFRSSFRDRASERGYARDLAERALAHMVANKVEAAYHRTDLLKQRSPLMEAWAKHVCGATA